MTIHFDAIAKFFFKEWKIIDDIYLFLSVLALILIYGSLSTFLTHQFQNGKILGSFAILFSAISMFIVMSYNFWVILVLLIGKGIGFFIFAIYEKRKLNKVIRNLKPNNN